MSNVNSARQVEGDWWSKPIPPNVIFGEGFYCETAQIFRHMHTTAPGAVRIGDMFRVTPVSFALGKNGLVFGFHARKWRVIMAEERIEIAALCLVEFLHRGSDFPHSRCPAAHRCQALAPFFKCATAPEVARAVTSP